MFKQILRYLILSFMPLTVALGEYRVFTSPDGAQIEAEVVSADESSLTIRMRDGRMFKNVAHDRFSAEDRKYIRSWLKQQADLVDNADLTADADIRISFLKGKDDDKNNYGDIDDRIVKFEPEIVLESLDYKKTYSDVSGTLVVVGQGVINSKQYAILSKQKFDLSVKPRDRARWIGKAFECRYDPDYGGFEYGGYLVVLRNRAGEIVMTKASKSAWEKLPQQVLKAKKMTGYNSDFSRTSSLFTTFGLPQGN